MSNVQELYLQTLINKKLHKDGGCLRKFLAHQRLHTRLQPFAADADERLSRGEEAVDLAMEEARDWLQGGQYKGMRILEDRITMHFSTDRLSSLMLEDSTNP